MYELRKYHGDKVQSLTYEDNTIAFSVGIISEGEYQFGSIKKEIFNVTLGSISSWVEGNESWKEYLKGDSFTIPSQKNFKLRVEGISSYICFYE